MDDSLAIKVNLLLSDPTELTCLYFLVKEPTPRNRHNFTATSPRGRVSPTRRRVTCLRTDNLNKRKGIYRAHAQFEHLREGEAVARLSA